MVAGLLLLDTGGVGESEARPLEEGESDDTGEEGAGEVALVVQEVDLANSNRFGGGVAAAGRPEAVPLPAAGTAALISEGELSTEVEKAGFSRPFRNWRYWLGWW